MLTDRWIMETRIRIERGEPVFPRDHEELIWLCEEYPKHAGRWLPPRCEMWHLGLPAAFGRMKPFVETWRERVILTLLEHSDFRSAMAVALRTGGDSWA
jgi:hypothetical protein